MQEQVHYHIKQDAAVEAMIASSLYHCQTDRAFPDLKRLPDVTWEDVQRCWGHVSGHVRLMRQSSPQYYEQQKNVLSAHHAVLMYVHENFDVFGRFGNQELLRELKEKNLFTGANLGEDVVGTNACIIAMRSPKGVWVIGKDHYAKALQDYACYAFQVKGKYATIGTVMLLTPLAYLNEETESLFRFIQSTELILTAGGAASEDMALKEIAIDNQYSGQYADDMMVIIGHEGVITYANNVFCERFKTSALDVINLGLQTQAPELFPVYEAAKREMKTITRRMRVNVAGNPGDYAVNCNPIYKEARACGVIITLSEERIDKSARKKSGNVAKYTFEDLVGTCSRFTELKHFAEEISKTTSSVLIQGESGTGKELFAHAMHNASDRREGPFIAVNCAAIPKDLIGSELFGYVGGSFTGANRAGAKGKFELADGGTLFLDEIGEMPLEMQSVLLRALEERTVTRLGGAVPIQVDIRLITATNRDLFAYVREGKFRMDLYYRLNVINLYVLPLRERKEDIPGLVDVFLRDYARKTGIRVRKVDPQAMGVMIEYDWPGNVRELKNVIERGAVLSKDGCISAEDLPEELRRKGAAQFSESTSWPQPTEPEDTMRLSDVVQGERRRLAESLLKQYENDKEIVAKKMGISRSTLYRILKK